MGKEKLSKLDFEFLLFRLDVEGIINFETGKTFITNFQIDTLAYYILKMSNLHHFRENFNNY